MRAIWSPSAGAAATVSDAMASTGFLNELKDFRISVSDMVGTGGAQPSAIAGAAMPAGAETDHRHSRRPGSHHARRRVLEDEHVLRPDSERARRVQVDIGMGLAASDMLGGAEQPVAEMVGEAEPLERTTQPMRRAGGGHGLGQRRKGLEEILESGDGGDLAQPQLEGLAGAGLEVSRQGSADLRFDPGAGIGPVQADIAVHRLPGGSGMADRGQRLGEDGVGQDFAVDDDAVEIEDQGLEPQRLSPNSAVPMRTWVAPVATAVS